MHPYAPTPSRVLERLERGWCKLVPDLPIFVTEVGWATAGEDPSGWKVVSEELQDQYLRAVIDIVRARSEALSIRLLTWYSLRDHDSEWRRGMWDHYCGVLKEDGKRKPSWTGLKESI
jgi:exo-beta-1,3-glucanase (GH17 family)